MATINSRTEVDKIIAANGLPYPDEDEPIVKIVEYRNAFDGGLAYGLVYKGEPRYDNCFGSNHRTLWERK